MIKSINSNVMNNDSIRNAVAVKLEEEGISLLRFACRCGIEQASLWRFMNKKTGLSGTNLLKLMECIDFPASERVADSHGHETRSDE